MLLDPGNGNLFDDDRCDAWLLFFYCERVWLYCTAQSAHLDTLIGLCAQTTHKDFDYLSEAACDYHVTRNKNPGFGLFGIAKKQNSSFKCHGKTTKVLSAVALDLEGAYGNVLHKPLIDELPRLQNAHPTFCKY